MQYYLLSVLAVSGVCLVALVRPGAGDPSLGGGGDGGANSIGRPSRPQVFSSPEELRTYLEQLSNYFAIAGRPRFGKRVAPSQQYRPSLNGLLANRMSSQMNEDDAGAKEASAETQFAGVAASDKASSNYRYPSPNGELYQLLFPYDKK